MKKIFYRAFILICLSTFCLSLGACGSKMADNIGGGNFDHSQIVDGETTQKIIYTVDYNLEFLDIQTNMDAIIKKSRELKGYVLQSSLSDNYGYYEIKVPTDKLDAFVDFIDSLGGTSNKKINTFDVTSEYNSIQAEIEVLEARKTAYLNMLKNDSLTLSQEMEINDALDKVTARLQALYFDKASYDSVLDYSTVTINCRTLDKDNSFFGDYWVYLRNLGIVFVYAFFYLLPFGIVAGVIVLIVISVSKKKKREKEKN